MAIILREVTVIDAKTGFLGHLAGIPMLDMALIRNLQ
jgi:hypothetical protein